MRAIKIICISTGFTDAEGGGGRGLVLPRLLQMGKWGVVGLRGLRFCLEIPVTD